MDPGRIAMDSLLLAVTATGAVTDVRVGKVWNTLTYPAVVAGLVLNAVLKSPVGLGIGPASLGLAVGFLPLFVFYLVGGIGGGDVKLMAAAGAFLGPYDAFVALFYACVTGAILVVAMVLWREGPMGMLGRLRSVIRLRGAETGDKPLRFPFGVGIFIGTAWAVTERNLGASALELLMHGGRA